MCKWDCDTGHLAGKPWKGKDGLEFALALLPDGKTFACGRAGGTRTENVLGRVITTRSIRSLGLPAKDKSSAGLKMGLENERAEKSKQERSSCVFAFWQFNCVKATELTALSVVYHLEHDCNLPALHPKTKIWCGIAQLCDTATLSAIWPRANLSLRVIILIGRYLAYHGNDEKVDVTY